MGRPGLRTLAVTPTLPTFRPNRTYPHPNAPAPLTRRRRAPATLQPAPPTLSTPRHPSAVIRFSAAPSAGRPHTPGRQLQPAGHNPKPCTSDAGFNQDPPARKPARRIPDTTPDRAISCTKIKTIKTHPNPAAGDTQTPARTTVRPQPVPPRTRSSLRLSTDLRPSKDHPSTPQRRQNNQPSSPPQPTNQTHRPPEHHQHSPEQTNNQNPQTRVCSPLVKGQEPMHPSPLPFKVPTSTPPLRNGGEGAGG
jgi:hypothetical protein